MNRYLLLAAAALILALTGCATMSEAIKDKDEGTTRLYDQSCGRLWPLSIQVFRDAGAGAE